MKNYIKHPSVYIGVPLLILIIALFVFSLKGSDTIDDVETSKDDTVVTELNLNEDGMLPVQLYYEEGVYNAKGTIKVPDPCYDVNTDVVVEESDPEQVDIIIKTKRRDEVCTTVVTEKEFEVEFTASEDAQITAILDDKKIDIIEMSKGI